MKSKCLIIGPGAVGAVYGYHLHRGGSDVSFFIRKKSLLKYKSGINLLWYNKDKSIFNFSDFSVISDPTEIKKNKWDYIILAVSSTAIRTELLKEILNNINPADETTLVSLQPGIEDQLFLSKLYDTEKTISGHITVISYQAPLENENIKECIAYWFPPMSPNAFSCERTRLEPLLKIFQKGKMPVTKTDDVNISTAFATSYFMPFLAALEANNWSFAKLKKNGWLKTVSAAANEAYAITEKYTGKKKPFTMNFISSPIVKSALSLQKFILPFDLEIYLKHHFLKVKDQTVLILKTFRDLGEKYNLKNENLNKLYKEIS